MKKGITVLIPTLLIHLLSSCQVITEVIPPDFEEKICVIAIINDAKDQNKIIIEKSSQNEYPSESMSHLEDLSVIILSESNVVFKYFNPYSENRFDTIYLPSTIELDAGLKYTLTISEKNTETVTSEIIVPAAPLIPEISIEGMVQTFLPPSAECHNPAKSIIFNQCR